MKKTALSDSNFLWPGTVEIYKTLVLSIGELMKLVSELSDVLFREAYAFCMYCSSDECFSVEQEGGQCNNISQLAHFPHHNLCDPSLGP